MTYRVVQWATGNVGRAAIEGVLAHPDLELAGAYVYSAAKAGLDVGEICGIDPVGVVATDDIEAILALGADCVVYIPMLANPDEVIRLLESGLDVVTPVGWIYPFRSHDVAAVEAACRAGDATLHGTGINPGGITEQIPLLLSAFCKDVRHVRAEEFSDIRTYDTELIVRDVMLFGKTPDEARASSMLAILGDGFGQSMDMVADALGVTLDPGKRTTHEMAVTTVDLDTPVGVIETGTVAAQRFTWEGLIDGEPFMTVRVNWLMGEENLDPAWTFGPEGERFEVEFDADPPLKASFHGMHPPSVETADLEHNEGILATAMHCVNAIPYVVEAEPGIRTYLDLPLMPGRAASSLSRT
ncbi:MAG: NAD(P)H-dependent amine dehydrogenase family protein [Acidimicrobiales bacterium]